MCKEITEGEKFTQPPFDGLISTPRGRNQTLDGEISPSVETLNGRISILGDPEVVKNQFITYREILGNSG